MSVLKALYGTSNQPITISLNSLANTAYRQSASVDNSTDLFLDVLVTVKGKAGASGVSASGQLFIYAYASTNGGTSFDGSASGTDSAYVPGSTPLNLAMVGALNLNVNAMQDQVTFSLAQAFGGTVPQKWGIVIFNGTGATLDGSAGGSVWYQGVQAQTV